MICYVHIFLNIYIYYIHIHTALLGVNWQIYPGSQGPINGIPRLAHAHTGREATRLSQENVALPCLALESHSMMPHQNTESVCSFLPNRWTPMIYIYI